MTAIPAELLNHVLRVASDPPRKLDGVDASNDQRVRLHRVGAGERRAAIHQHASCYEHDVRPSVRLSVCLSVGGL